MVDFVSGRCLFLVIYFSLFFLRSSRSSSNVSSVYNHLWGCTSHLRVYFAVECAHCDNLNDRPEIGILTPLVLPHFDLKDHYAMTLQSFIYVRVNYPSLYDVITKSALRMPIFYKNKSDFTSDSLKKPAGDVLHCENCNKGQCFI